MALFFPIEAGKLHLMLNCQVPFQDMHQLLLKPGTSANVLVSNLVLLLQGGLLNTTCQQLQALYILSHASQHSTLGKAIIVQAAASEAVSLVVRAFALSLLTNDPAALAPLTPQQFIHNFSPECVLLVPTLAELQSQHLLSVAEANPTAPVWALDASAVRSVVLPPAETAALQQLLVWSDRTSLQDCSVLVEGISHAAADVSLALQRFAATVLRLSYSLQGDNYLGESHQSQQAEQRDRERYVHEAASPSPEMAACVSCVEASSAQPEAAHLQLQAAAPAGGMEISAGLHAECSVSLSQEVPCTSPGSLQAAAAANCRTSTAEQGAEQDAARLSTLLTQAQRYPLLPSDQKELVVALKGSAAALASCQIDLNQYSGLVENNPLVAAWLLISINWHTQQAHEEGVQAQRSATPPAHLPHLEAFSKAIPNYLAVLCTLPMTNHSMECMTTLLDLAPPPPTVVAVFVANCIRTIDGTQEVSRQSRLAKLLCAFLQHLLDEGQDGVASAIYADVQSFCIAWSRLKEAAALFQRLKAMESAEAGSEGSAGGEG